MATDTPAAGDRRTEHCQVCDGPTKHVVTVEIRTESDAPDATARKFSREPYRVSTCRVCETETVTRMNNA